MSDVDNCLRRIGVLLSLSLLSGLMKDFISAYKAQPCWGWVGNLCTAEHFFMLLIDSGRQEWPMFSAYVFCKMGLWLEKLLVGCGNEYLGSCSYSVTAPCRSVLHSSVSHGMTHTHTHTQSISAVMHVFPQTLLKAKGVLVSDHVRLSRGSSVTAVHPGSSSVGPSKSGGSKLTHKIFITLWSHNGQILLLFKNSA